MNNFNDDLTYESNEYLLDLDENIENEMIDYEDINLSSFKIKNELNPKIWKKNELNSSIRLKLLDIADEFWGDLTVNWVEPEDIILAGSICNYNWSKFSDIDLHLIVDFNKIHENEEFVKEYFDSQKKLWNETHKYLTICDFPVEIYVQNVNDELESSGVYSLTKHKWLIKPEKNTLKFNNDVEIKKLSAKYINRIDSLMEEFDNTYDEYELENLKLKIDNLYKTIKKMRKDSLEEDGEMSKGNIVFKVLRRSGYIGKLIDLKNYAFDRYMSM